MIQSLTMKVLSGNIIIFRDYFIYICVKYFDVYLANKIFIKLYLKYFYDCQFSLINILIYILRDFDKLCEKERESSTSTL